MLMENQDNQVTLEEMTEEEQAEAAKVAQMSHKERRRYEDEKMLEEHEKSKTVSEETSEEAEESPEESPEEATFKKRYGDLRRHQQQQQQEYKTELKKLQEQVESLTKAQMKLPKTDEEVDAWYKEYPDVAGIVETIAAKKLQESQPNIEKAQERLDQLERSIAQKKAEETLKDLHPDFEELRGNKDFHEWASVQPEMIQKALYDSDTLDPIAAGKAITLFKVETGQSEAKKSSKKVAQKVASSGRSSAPEDTKATWSESKVDSMTALDFEKYEAEISDAIRSGKFIYDISGAAR